MMVTELVAAQLQRLIAERLDLDVKEVTFSSRFIEDLHADSLALVEILLCVEEEFNIDIPDEDIEQIATVQSAVQYLNKRLGSPP